MPSLARAGNCKERKPFAIARAQAKPLHAWSAKGQRKQGSIYVSNGNGRQYETVDAMTGEVLGPQALAPRGYERAELAVGATTALAMAAKEQAVVKARFERADIRPRSWANVRQKLLDECKRKGFAEEAIYSKPVGQEDIKGFSIRFAEAALRCIGNVDCFADLIDQDRTQLFYRVGALDLETNASFGGTITISKLIERSRELPGMQLMGRRKNSKGRDVYIYIGTDDDVRNNINRNISFARRGAILSLLPADIKDECWTEIERTLRADVDRDPAKARKDVVDGFATLGVTAQELEEYLGHPIDQMKVVEVTELRRVFAGLRTGETQWADVMATRPDRGPKKPAAPPPAANAGAPAPQQQQQNAAPQEAAQTETVPSGSAPAEAQEDNSLVGRIRRMTKEQLPAFQDELNRMAKGEERNLAARAFSERRKELGIQ